VRAIGKDERDQVGPDGFFRGVVIGQETVEPNLLLLRRPAFDAARDAVENGADRRRLQYRASGQEMTQSS
jgi:hypothetical protein